MGLFADGNPYRDALPDIFGRLKLSLDDFDGAVSSRNLEAVGREAKWTLFLYQAADVKENLAVTMFDDLMEVKRVGSSDDVHVCSLFDGPLLTDSFFARLNPETPFAEDIILRFLEIYSNRAGTLKDLALNTAVLYPSEKKVLVLSGHGQAWRGAMTDDNLWKEYRSQSQRALPADSETCHQRILEAYHRTMKTMKERLAVLSANDPCYKPFKFDILAFDACGMANLEALCNYTDFATLLIASEDQMPGEGYPYDLILRQLTAAPSQSPSEFSAMLVTVTAERYAQQREKLAGLCVTQAIFDSEKLPQLGEHLGALSRSLVEFLDVSGRATIAECLGEAARFDNGCVDLKGFVLLLLQKPVPVSLRTAAEEMIAFWDHSGFITARILSTKDAQPYGLSIYAPVAKEGFSVDYFEAVEKTPLMREWVCFLSRYLDVPGPLS